MGLQLVFSRVPGDLLPPNLFIVLLVAMRCIMDWAVEEGFINGFKVGGRE